MVDVPKLLARAFADDPVSALLAPRPQTRLADLEWFFSACERHASRQGGRLEVPGGALLWLVGQLGPGPWEAWRSGLGALPWRTGPGGIWRLSRHQAAAARMIHGTRAQRFGYLWFAGVEKAQRQRGTARILVEQLMTALRARGVETCLLTTEKEHNRRIWQRLGFVEVAYQDATPAGLPLWLMSRGTDVPLASVAT